MGQHPHPFHYRIPEGAQVLGSGIRRVCLLLALGPGGGRVLEGARDHTKQRDVWPTWPTCQVCGTVLHPADKASPGHPSLPPANTGWPYLAAPHPPSRPPLRPPGAPHSPSLHADGLALLKAGEAPHGGAAASIVDHAVYTWVAWRSSGRGEGLWGAVGGMKGRGHSFQKPYQPATGVAIGDLRVRCCCLISSSSCSHSSLSLTLCVSPVTAHVHTECFSLRSLTHARTHAGAAGTSA